MTDKVIIYTDKDKKIQLYVTLERETLWLSLKEISELFDRNKSVISRHLKNIFDKKELSRSSVVANFATTADDGKTYQVEYYNLDAILSVGYRVNSKQGTKFRIWATNILKTHLSNGYTINKLRLLERDIQEREEVLLLLEKLTKIDCQYLFSRIKSDDIFNIINKYQKTWTTLLDYDNSNLRFPKKLRTINTQLFDKNKIINLIDDFKTELINKNEASELFGKDTSNNLDRIISSIEQTFDGKFLYETVEEKAAHLLYFIIKDHPFIDGNKRIGAFLFMYYVNSYQLNIEIGKNTLIAIAIMVAESDPAQKDLMIKLIMNLIA
jgi:DNA ligase (NAD+)